MIDKKRLDFLQQYVSNDANVRELLEYYRENILLHPHTPNTYTRTDLYYKTPTV